MGPDKVRKQGIDLFEVENGDTNRQSLEKIQKFRQSTHLNDITLPSLCLRSFSHIAPLVYGFRICFCYSISKPTFKTNQYIPCLTLSQKLDLIVAITLVSLGSELPTLSCKMLFFGHFIAIR